MPIRPENRARYPKDWKAIGQAIRRRARDHCEQCGVANGTLGGRTGDGAWHPAIPYGDGNLPRPGSWATCEGNLNLRIIKIVLTVAHLDHVPENCAPENLQALCQRCHNLMDGPMRRAGTRARKWADQLQLDLKGQSDD
jgi:5-methylcytosine-specific restriction endonuclease McrA